MVLNLCFLMVLYHSITKQLPKKRDTHQTIPETKRDSQTEGRKGLFPLFSIDVASFSLRFSLALAVQSQYKHQNSPSTWFRAVLTPVRRW